MKTQASLFTAVLATVLVCCMYGWSEAATTGDLRRPVSAMAGPALPVAFEENQGQLDAPVQFLARGKDTTLFLTRDAAVLALHPRGGNAGAALRISLLGAEADACLEGRDPLPGRVSFLRGSDAASWLRDVPTCAQVRYQDVYPGIDLVFHGSEGQLEYDFVVKPGADTTAIRLRFEGADTIATSAAGELLLGAGGREIIQHAPVAYQVADGHRTPVASRVVLSGEEVSFAVGDFDRSRELVIDPVLGFSTFLGGSASDDYGQAVAVDGSGSVYVTGYTQSVDFPTTSGAFDPTYAVMDDVFVTKLDPTGSALVYSTYLGGSNHDDPYDIKVDASGNAYVAGRTYSSDFPTTAGAFDRTLGGDSDAFVVKLNPTGSQLLFSTYLGGTALGQDTVFSIAIDTAGNVFAAGSTSSADFPTTPGAFDRTYADGDAFVSKLSPGGTGLIYSTFLGGGAVKHGQDPGCGQDAINGVAIDASGSVYACGLTCSPNFPTTTGAYDRTLSGTWDAFVTKLNPAGSALVYSTYLGGTATPQERARGIVVDTAGTAFVMGVTQSSDFPTTAGAYDRTWNGAEDTFVTRLNAAGSGLIYSTLMGGTLRDDPRGFAVDGSGAAYVTGFTYSTNFPTTPDALDGTHDGLIDAFVAKLSPAGSALAYGSYIGGGSHDLSYACAYRGSSLYVVGLSSSQDFPVTPGAFQTTLQGTSSDAFVLRFDF